MVRFKVKDLAICLAVVYRERLFNSALEAPSSDLQLKGLAIHDVLGEVLTHLDEHPKGWFVFSRTFSNTHSLSGSLSQTGLSVGM